jgi:hypothetical protein
LLVLFLEKCFQFIHELDAYSGRVRGRGVTESSRIARSRSIDDEMSNRTATERRNSPKSKQHVTKIENFHSDLA